MNTVTIYTDGACKGNQHANATGGYGTVIFNDKKRKELAQGYSDTTNNRMELRAVIAALKALKRPCRVELYTDSNYVCKAFNDNWIAGWIKRGWKNASKKPVANRDLWEELLAVVDTHEITWNWVKGHAGDPLNERADELACLAAAGELIKDVGETIITVVE